MSGNLALITCGFDLREEHIAEAIGSREGTKGLLLHLSSISAPDTGVAKVLLLYARMATTACDWLDEDLWIDLVEEGDVTSVEAFTELGGGFRERLFAPMAFRAPLAEFARAISRVPHMVSPLTTRQMGATRIRLSATEQIRRTTFPPPPFTIAAESLLVRLSPPPFRPRRARRSWSYPCRSSIGGPVISRFRSCAPKASRRRRRRSHPFMMSTRGGTTSAGDGERTARDAKDATVREERAADDDARHARSNMGTLELTSPAGS